MTFLHLHTYIHTYSFIRRTKRVWPFHYTIPTLSLLRIAVTKPETITPTYVYIRVSTTNCWPKATEKQPCATHTHSHMYILPGFCLTAVKREVVYKRGYWIDSEASCTTVWGGFFFFFSARFHYQGPALISHSRWDVSLGYTLAVFQVAISVACGGLGNHLHLCSACVWFYGMVFISILM